MDNIATVVEIVKVMFRRVHSQAILTGMNEAGELVQIEADPEVIDFLTALGMVNERKLTATGCEAYKYLTRPPRQRHDAEMWTGDKAVQMHTQLAEMAEAVGDADRADRHRHLAVRAAENGS